MKHILSVSSSLVFTCILALDSVPASAADDVDIQYSRFVLDNGLTLIVHEDHKAPIVCVNVWYHVGSKNEKVGKTGFAHLFEHLMYNGSENFDDDYFRALDRLGATDVNGTTWLDRTNYFQNVPVTALDAVLWMESDRMGHMLGAVTQEKLDEQRGVVQNEKRRGEDQPYARAESRLGELMFPVGHPYSWDTIGSMADLEAASLEDVHEWFESYYGAANATLVIAGDINTDEVHARVIEYFGDIDSGPVVARLDKWVPRRTEEVREVMQDRVPQARLTKAWVLPEYTDPDRQYLDLVSDVLALGKTSRLFKRLVYDDQIATNVQASVYPFEIAGVLQIDVTAQPGGDLAQVERALDEELARLLADGPTQREVERVKTQHVARFIRNIEEIGYFGGKAQRLAMNQVYAGNPEHYKVKLHRVRSATPQDLGDAARQWLSSGASVIEVYPFPEYASSESQIDRSELPMPDSFPEVRFPTMERATLDNGLQIILVERQAVPVVGFRLVVDAGHASDQLGLLGTSSLAVSMMEEGTKKRSSLEISEELAMLGATLSMQSTLDQNVVSFSALKENLDASLDILADVVLNPAFPQVEFQRVQKQRIASIQREKATPRNLMYRLFPPLLFGTDHAYGLPLTGTGTETSVADLTRDDLIDFHRTWFRPNNATLVIVGATTLGEIVPQIERRFGNWKATEVPTKNLAPVARRTRAEVYVVDRPESEQSMIFAVHLAPPKANPNDIANEALNDILGGTFTSRLNMNLREDKHWAYYARTSLTSVRGPGAYLLFTEAQADKTAESMAEIQREISAIVGEAPPTAEELAKVKDKNTLTLPGRWERNDAVARDILELVRFGLDDGYWDEFPKQIRGLQLDQVRQAAQELYNPDGLLWVVIGDRAQIEAPIQALGFADIQWLDVDGNRL